MARLHQVLRRGVGIRTGRRGGQVGHTVAEEVGIGIDVDAQPASQFFAITQAELHTPVAQRGTIQPGSAALTQGSQIGGRDEHIVHILHVAINAAIQRAVEQGEVRTYVELLG